MAETTRTYYVTCPICRNELFKTAFTSMEMLCPKCHNDLSIYVLGETVIVTKRKSHSLMDEAIRERVMAYQKVLLQKERGLAEPVAKRK